MILCKNICAIISENSSILYKKTFNPKLFRCFILINSKISRMGISGLWDSIPDAIERVPCSHLERKVIAVDLACWVMGNSYKDKHL